MLLPPASQPTIRELLFCAIEVAAADAAESENENALRNDEGRSLGDLVNPDDLDSVRHRLQGPRWRLTRFFATLPTEDLHVLAALYWANRDSRGDSLTPSDSLLHTLNNVTRNKNGDAEKTREECLRKLTSVGASNLVLEFSEALSSDFSSAAEKLRSEFSVYKIP